MTALGGKAGGPGVVVSNSILSGNKMASQGKESFGDVEFSDNNVLGDSSQDNLKSFYGEQPDQDTNIIATSNGNRPTDLDSILAPLANNGGGTLTHALVEGSPAINAANNAACPNIDQRGQSREDRDCDIGAFEAFGLAGDPRTPEEAEVVVLPILDLILNGE